MTSKLTRAVPRQAIVEDLRAAAARAGDGNASVSKDAATKAADYIESLIAELCNAQQEASEAGAELSGLAGNHFTKDDVLKYGQRDARIASRTLSALIKRVGDFFPETA